MKKIIYGFAFSAMMAGAVLTSCDSKQEKVEDAKEEVTEAKEELKDAQQEVNAEYPAFRKENDERIAANQTEIDRLRKIVAKPGEKPLDNARRDRIDDIERRNTDLRTRLDGYETKRSNWDEFKREFNHDMDELGNSFKDMGKDNVK